MTNKSHLQYGLIISAILILLSVVFYILNMNEQKWTQWVGVVIMFIGVVVSCMLYAKANDGNVTFGNVFATGFKTTAIIALVTALFAVIFIMIFPDIKEKALEQARLDMEKQGQSDAAIEQALDITKRMFLVFVLGFSIFFNLFFGALASVIGAAAARRNPHYQAPQK